VQLSAGLAGALQLPAGTEVLMEALPQLAAAAAVIVEPASAADWEVVELNAGLLEDMLLSQVGCCGLHALSLLCVTASCMRCCVRVGATGRQIRAV
jgi:hypothetical protein